jgi:alcohol dehydrogenase class IV
LASVYRACLEFTWTSAVSSFATLARLLDPALDEVPARDAAERCPDLLQAFLARIDLACSLRDFGISQEELTALAKQSMVFPYYQNAPRVPTPNEMLELIADSY